MAREREGKRGLHGQATGVATLTYSVTCVCSLHPLDRKIPTATMLATVVERKLAPGSPRYSTVPQYLTYFPYIQFRPSLLVSHVGLCKINRYGRTDCIGTNPV